MRLDRTARTKIKWGLGLASLAFYMLHPFGIVFWVLFWSTAAAFLLFGNLVDLVLPLDPDED